CTAHALACHSLLNSLSVFSTRVKNSTFQGQPHTEAHSENLHGFVRLHLHAQAKNPLAEGSQWQVAAPVSPLLGGRTGFL
ncbi:hypothetical protein, partial [Acidovorax sp. HMWF018]|uniref:hypothetical protein n=1 Tax=Acidovorax sp. HMWF018 TaxID=2056855 RepID=UPI001E416B1B